MRPGRRAPRTVGDLSDEQVNRWREGDNRIWGEDRRGRPLTRGALRRREAASRRDERRAARRER